MLGWFKRKKRDPKEQLAAALGDFDLPSFPIVANRALGMLRDPDSSLGDVGDALSEDPGLSARVLDIANSSAFALRNPVRNVGHAISLLGRSAVEPLILAVVVGQSLPDPQIDVFDRRQFWQGAARRATCARALADMLQPRLRSESFTAALLSDMAVPLIASAHGEAYAPILRQWTEDGGNLAELEQQALGFDHASVAGWVAQTWHFPSVLADAIGSHHDQNVAHHEGQPVAVSLVAMLDDGDAGRAGLIDTVSSHFGVPADTIAAIVDASASEASEIADRML